MKYSILLLLWLWGSITTLYSQCDTVSVGVKSDGTELKAAAFSSIAISNRLLFLLMGRSC